MILSGAVKSLYAADSDLALITCHDALYATPGIIQSVREGLFVQFEKTYGVRPNIQIDDYSDLPVQPEWDMFYEDVAGIDPGTLPGGFGNHLGSILYQ